MKSMAQKVRAFLLGAVSLCLLVSFLPKLTMPARADGVIVGTQGMGTEEDPIVCDTYDEFWQAMRSSANYHILLKISGTVTLPARAPGEGPAAIVQYPGTTKHLTVMMNASFSAGVNGYFNLLHIPVGSKLEIDGTGSLTFSSERTSALSDYNEMWDSSCLLYVNGECTIGESVKLFGKVSTAKNSIYSAGVRVVDVDGGKLTVSGNPTLQGELFQGGNRCNSNIAAVTVRDMGKLIVTGGRFHMDLTVTDAVEGLDSEANIDYACGLYVYYDPDHYEEWWTHSVSKDISLSGGEFKGLYLFKYGNAPGDDEFSDIYLMLDENVKALDYTNVVFCDLNDYRSPYTVKKYKYTNNIGNKISTEAYNFNWISLIKPENAIAFEEQNPPAKQNAYDTIIRYKGVTYDFSFTNQKMPDGFKALGYQIKRDIVLYEYEDFLAQNAVCVASEQGTTEYGLQKTTLTYTFPENTPDNTMYKLDYVVSIYDKNGNYCTSKTNSLYIQAMSRIDLNLFYESALPKVGENGFDKIEVDTDAYSASGGWYQVTNGYVSSSPVTKFERFLPGTTYRLFLTFTTKDTHRFTEDSTVDFQPVGSNEVKPFVTEYVSSTTMTGYYDVTLPNVIDKVEADLPELFAGAYTANVERPENSIYTSIATQWYEEDKTASTGWKYLWDDFKTPVKITNGKKYRIQVNFQLNKEGYEYTDDISCYLSGEKATLVSVVYTDEGFYARFTYEFTCQNTLKNIDFTMDELLPGKTLASCKASLEWTSNALPNTLKVSDIIWNVRNGTAPKDNEPMTEGTIYEIGIGVTPIDGLCTIDDAFSINATFNGEPMLVNQRGDTVYFLTYVFVPYMINSSNIKITLPTVTVDGVERTGVIAGEPLPVPIPPEGTEILSYTWKKAAKSASEVDAEVPNSSLAEAGERYKCKVTLRVIEGYKFDEYINGITLTNVFTGGMDGYIRSTSEDTLVIQTTFDQSIPTCVKLVSIVDSPIPMAGDNIPAEIPAGKLETEGVGLFSKGTWDAEGKFTEGNTYKLTFKIRTEDENTLLADDLRVLVNGIEANVTEIRLDRIATVTVSLTARKTLSNAKIYYAADHAPYVGKKIVVDMEKTLASDDGMLESYLEGRLSYRWFLNNMPLGSERMVEDDSNLVFEVMPEYRDCSIHIEFFYDDYRAPGDPVEILPMKAFNLVIKKPVAGENAEVVFVDKDGVIIKTAYTYWRYQSAKFTGTFEAGKAYKVMIALQVPAEDADAVFTINGVEVKPTIHPDGTIILQNEFTVGSTVLGEVTAYGEIGSITVELFKEGSEAASYSTAVQGGNGIAVSYVIEDVVPDTYRLKVSKSGHETREYTVTVGSNDVTFNVVLQLKGDITVDGTVDIADVLLLFRHIMMPLLYPVEYVGNMDFTNDTALDIADALLLFRHSMMPDMYPLA